MEILKPTDIQELLTNEMLSQYKNNLQNTIKKTWSNFRKCQEHEECRLKLILSIYSIANIINRTIHLHETQEPIISIVLEPNVIIDDWEKLSLERVKNLESLLMAVGNHKDSDEIFQWWRYLIRSSEVAAKLSSLTNNMLLMIDKNIPFLSNLYRTVAIMEQIALEEKPNILN